MRGFGAEKKTKQNKNRNKTEELSKAVNPINKATQQSHQNEIKQQNKMFKIDYLWVTSLFSGSVSFCNASPFKPLGFNGYLIYQDQGQLKTIE